MNVLILILILILIVIVVLYCTRMDGWMDNNVPRPQDIVIRYVRYRDAMSLIITLSPINYY